MSVVSKIQKLASGTSARNAARAHALSLLPGANPSSTEVDPAEEFKATIEAMFLVAAVDGDISKQERNQLAASIQAIVDTHAMDGIRLEETLQEFGFKLGRDGWNARLSAVSQRIRSHEGRVFAFRLAASVAFIDDHVAHAEAAAIDALGRALHLSADDTQDILEEVHEELFGAA